MVRIVLCAGGLFLAASCRRAQPDEPYVRVSGVAPAIADAPATHATLLAFWATWCAPCVEESRALKALASDPPRGLAVVVVSEDERRSDVERFFDGSPPPELHLRLDEKKALAGRLGVDQIPTSFLIREGRLVARFDGARDWGGRRMRATLEKLIR